MLKLCELVTKGSLNELQKELAKTASISDTINRKSNYVMLSGITSQFGPILHILRDYKSALAWLWGEWHLNLVRTSFRRFLQLRQNNRLLKSLIDQFLLKSSRSLLRKGRTCIEHKITLTIASLCCQDSEIFNFLLENGSQIGSYELVLCIRLGNLKMFSDIISLCHAPSVFGLRKGGVLDFSKNLKLWMSTIYMNRTIIDFAFQWKRMDIIWFVLRHTCLDFINQRSSQVPLMESLIKCGGVEVLQEVLHGNPALSIIKIAKRFNQTPLHIAAANLKYAESLLLIKEYGAFLNIADDQKMLPMHSAILGFCQLSKNTQFCKNAANIIADFIKLVALLLKSGSPCDAKDIQGYTPLQLFMTHYLGVDSASKEAHWLNKIFNGFLYAGANIDQSDNNGDTLLHYCARFKFPNVAKLLIQNGADPYIKNCDGQIPSQVTHNQNLKLIIECRKTVPPLRILAARMLKKPLPCFILKSL